MKHMNVVILAGGEIPTSLQEQPNHYPDYLTEHDGVPLIEHLIEQCGELNPENIICLLPQIETTRYHLHNMVQQINPVAQVIPICKQTAGAACTALLACEVIDNDNPLLVMGCNEFLSFPLQPVLEGFQQSGADAGVFTFKSTHPRYAFVCLDENTKVIEVAEKNPISTHAITGTFWFKSGACFVEAVKNMIRKDAKTNNAFYIAPVLNELILGQQRIASHAISPKQYHSLRSKNQLYAFETGSVS